MLNDLNFQGFYAVYKEVFRVIAEEDYTFMDDKEENNEHPEFGDSQSSYEEVSKQMLFLFIHVQSNVVWDFVIILAHVHG